MKSPESTAAFTSGPVAMFVSPEKTYKEGLEGSQGLEGFVGLEGL